MRRLEFSVLLKAALIMLAFGEPRIVVAQRGAVIRISDNATGGDCQLIGNWDRNSKTCTVTRDLIGTIEILNNSIVLDGNGKTLSAPAPGVVAKPVAVKIDSREQVTIQNLKVTGFHEGIYIIRGKNNRITGNTVTGTTNGAAIDLTKTTLNTIEGNTVINNKSIGIKLLRANTNQIRRNILTKNRSAGIYFTNANRNVITKNSITGDPTLQSRGMRLVSSHENQILWNTIKTHRWQGIGFFNSNANTVKYNDFQSNSMGFFSGVTIIGQGNKVLCNDFKTHPKAIDLRRNAARNEIYYNNFLLNDTAVDLVGVGLNKFNLAKPIGGNYWQVHAPNCQDGNPRDGFCDAAYVFRGNQDNFPHVVPIAWRTDPSICEPVVDIDTDCLDLYEEWLAAYDLRNVDGLLALLASDIVIIPPNELPLEGKKAVRSYYQKVFSKSETNQLFFYMETFEAAGKLGRIQGRVEEMNAYGVWEDRFSFSMIIQGSDKGYWEIYRFLWY